MANPLARVVMNNVSEKVKGKVEYKRDYNSGSYNLTKTQEDMLKGIINTGTKPIHTVRKNMVTLEELANMIKDSSQ